MGLCKCPKRKVSTLFCFEHRVNVCESCLVTEHSQCVVQSYLQWLQDSDYTSNCLVCSNSLNEKGAIRFLCLHVFHIDCIDKLFSQLPKNTAPNGYACPSCKECIFFSPNVKSPLAEELRYQLKHSFKLTKFPFNLESLSGTIGHSHKNGPSHFDSTTEILSTPSSIMNERKEKDEKRHAHSSAKLSSDNNDDEMAKSTNKISNPIEIEFSDPRHDEFKGKHSFSKNTTKDNLTRKIILMGKRMAYNFGFGKSHNQSRTTLSPYTLGSRSRRFLLFFLFLALIILFFVVISHSPNYLRSGPSHHEADHDSHNGIHNGEWGNFDPMLDPDANPMIKIRRN